MVAGSISAAFPFPLPSGTGTAKRRAKQPSSCGSPHTADRSGIVINGSIKSVRVVVIALMSLGAAPVESERDIDPVLFARPSPKVDHKLAADQS